MDSTILTQRFTGQTKESTDAGADPYLHARCYGDDDQQDFLIS